MDLQGKRVLVVGGSSGVGFAVARQAAEAGAQVVVATSNAQRVAAAVERLPGAEGVVVDVRDERDVVRAAEAAGALDHLVYTAGDWGSVRGRAIADLDLDEAHRAWEVRFWGALRVIKAVLPRMTSGGSIGLTSGLLGHRPQKGSMFSTAGVGAIEHMTRALAVDLAPVRVNCVCLGLIATEAVTSFISAARGEAMTARQPLARVGEPAEAAEAYVHLMGATYTTGQVLHVDGGAVIV
jgi:NAD(P)-dependent dehydrogenase (short-subunit alcohol dehydrogenase family)